MGAYEQPMKTIDTLVDDIYALLDQGIEVPQKAVEHLGGSIAKKVAAALRRPLENRPPTLRLSNVGRPCKRQVWYELHGVEGEPLAPYTRIKFLFGDILEELLLFLAEQAGHTVEDRQETLEVAGVVGHIDAVIDDVLVDVKSTTTRSFSKFEQGDMGDDPFGYVTQLDAYAHAKSAKRKGWLAVDKQLGHLVFAERTDDTPVVADIQRTKALMASDTPPDRGFDPVPEGKSGNMKLPVPCAYCAFKHTCHPGLRTFMYASGPVFLTEVRSLPRVSEVIA